MPVRSTFWISFVFASLAVFGALGEAAQAPAPLQAPTFRSETRLVLVDTIVTDKEGNSIRDLTAQDFRVWEDGKEQQVKGFSFESGGAPGGPVRYIVVFFDSTTIADPAVAKAVAARFIEENAAPHRVMAIVNFSGTLRIVQNFTSNIARLEKALQTNLGPGLVAGQEVIALRDTTGASAMSSAAMGAVALSNAEMEFRSATVLLALRSLANNLAQIPGRKTLVFFSAGFPMTLERWPDLNGAIDACNRANVSIYPVDVRALTMPAPAADPAGSALHNGLPAHPDSVGLMPTLFGRWDSPLLRTAAFFPQSGGERGSGGGHTRPSPDSGPPPRTAPSGGAGSGGTGGGGRTGGGGTGRGTGGGVMPGRTGPGGYTPGERPPVLPRGNLIPEFPRLNDSRDVLFALAQGTGGVFIRNTRELLGAMNRIARDQDEYYIVAFSPVQYEEGCHSLKVKVERRGALVRSRTGYCTTKPLDVLAGSQTAKLLEAEVVSPRTVNAGGSVALPFFYTAPNVARVNLVLDIPAENMRFEEQKGKYHSAVNILGIAYRPDGGVAARFSDVVNVDLESKKEAEEFKRQPYHYEKQFQIAAGEYVLKLALGSETQVLLKREAPLKIEPYDGKLFCVSALVLSNTLLDLTGNIAGIDQSLLEDRTPLIFQNKQVVPSASSRFKKTDPALMYAEVYDPLLATDLNTTVSVKYQIVDRQTGAMKLDTGVLKAPWIRAGSPVVPVVLRIPPDRLGTGAYRLLFQARDSAGRMSAVRTIEFEVE